MDLSRNMNVSVFETNIRIIGGWVTSDWDRCAVDCCSSCKLKWTINLRWSLVGSYALFTCSKYFFIK
jgi:hypothetical protein